MSTNFHFHLENNGTHNIVKPLGAIVVKLPQLARRFEQKIGDFAQQLPSTIGRLLIRQPRELFKVIKI